MQLAMAQSEALRWKWTLETDDGESTEICVRVSPFIVHLRTAFGTSHSTTTLRCNALLSVALIPKQPNEAPIDSDLTR